MCPPILNSDKVFNKMVGRILVTMPRKIVLSLIVQVVSPFFGKTNRRKIFTLYLGHNRFCLSCSALILLSLGFLDGEIYLRYVGWFEIDSILSHVAPDTANLVYIGRRLSNGLSCSAALGAFVCIPTCGGQYGRLAWKGEEKEEVASFSNGSVCIPKSNDRGPCFHPMLNFRLILFAVAHREAGVFFVKVFDNWVKCRIFIA